MFAKSLSPIMVLGALALAVGVADRVAQSPTRPAGAAGLVTGSIDRGVPPKVESPSLAVIPLVAAQPVPIEILPNRARDGTAAQSSGGEVTKGEVAKGAGGTDGASDERPRTDAIVPPIRRVRTSVIPVARPEGAELEAVPRPSASIEPATKRQARPLPASLRGRQGLGGDRLCAPGFTYSTKQLRCLRTTSKR